MTKVNLNKMESWMQNLSLVNESIRKETMQEIKDYVKGKEMSSNAELKARKLVEAFVNETNRIIIE
ncbi:hypothetical protein ACFL5S_00055 [Fibrobacterota bacterium]